MSKKLQKHTLNLREGDFEKLSSMFPSQPASHTLRVILSAFVDKYYVEGTPVDLKNTDISL